MPRKNWLLVLALVAILAVIGVACGETAEPEGTGTEEQAGPVAPEAGEQEEPSESQTPEGTTGEVQRVSSADKPEGCVSCHEGEHSLAEEIKAMVEEGTHIQTDAAAPGDCLQCHADNFAQKLHTAHLSGTENHFVTNYGGACVNCHVLGEDGKVVVKALTDSGVTPVTLETTTEDKAPEGCVSCHEGEHSLAEEIKAMVEEGTHIQTDAAAPGDCLQCHADNFAEKLHPAHLTGEENHFVANYGASCNNCHTLGDDGTISVKGL